jgi:peptidoglycan/LPS O-acetylase OafA/YrhL
MHFSNKSAPELIERVEVVHRDGGRVLFANTLRGFAALSVLVSHYLGVFWLNPGAVEYLTNAPPPASGAYSLPSYISWLHAVPLFNWGAYGVALFFLISGFVIPFSLRRVGWIAFVTGRCFRIVPTYVVGFSITLVAVYLCSSHYGRGWPYSINEVLIHFIPGLRDILQSKAIDGVVWTLEIEVKFYLICALLICWFRQLSLKLFVMPILLFFTSVLFSLGSALNWWVNDAMLHMMVVFAGFSQYIVFMFCGVVFHYVYQNRLTFISGVVYLVCFGGMFILQWWIGPYPETVWVAWSYVAALITFLCAFIFRDRFRRFRLLDFFAEISYPLYVVHGVAGYVLLRVLLDASFKAWISLVLVTASCFFVAWLIHIFVERPSQALSRQLLARNP